MSDFEVRIATHADIPAIAELRWAEDAAEGDTSDDRADFVSRYVEWVNTNPAYHCVMAVVGGAVVGFAWLAELPRVPRPGRIFRAGGDIQSVFVSPVHRNGGIGTAMIRRVLQLSAELGLLSVTVHSSGGAIPMYQRVGFAPQQNLMTIDIA